MLPDWIPIEPWNEFVAMRKRIKKPLTEYATKLAIGKLTKLKDAGQDLTEVINESILRQWDTFWPIKAQKQELGPWWSTPDQVTAKAKELHLEPKRGETPDMFKARINLVIQHGGVEAVAPARQYQAEPATTFSRETARAELQRAIALTKRH